MYKISEEMKNKALNAASSEPTVATSREMPAFTALKVNSSQWKHLRTNPNRETTGLRSNIRAIMPHERNF